jgi:hypothetical protein
MVIFVFVVEEGGYEAPVEVARVCGEFVGG